MVLLPSSFKVTVKQLTRLKYCCTDISTLECLISLLAFILLAWYVISSLLWQWTQSINPLIKKLQSCDGQKELSDIQQPMYCGALSLCFPLTAPTAASWGDQDPGKPGNCIFNFSIPLSQPYRN